MKPDLTPSPHLAYLLGALLGDGTVFSKGLRNIVSLKVNKYPFAYNVYEAMKSIGLRPTLRQSKNNHNGTMWLTCATSINFCKWYKSLTPEDIESIAKEYPLDFLRGFYEAEGNRYYDKHGVLYIKISNKNARLLDICAKTLGRLGYQCRIYKQSKQNYYWYVLYVFGTTEEKKRFLNMLSPCIKGVD